MEIRVEIRLSATAVSQGEGKEEGRSGVTRSLRGGIFRSSWMPGCRLRGLSVTSPVDDGRWHVY